MRIIYRKRIEPAIAVTVTPPSETLGDLLVEWAVIDGKISSISFTMAGVTLDEDERGAINTYNDAVMARVFAAARFVGDRIRIQTGFDVLDPFDFVGSSPSEIYGETPEEEAYLTQRVKHAQRSVRAMVLLTRAFNPVESADFDRLAVPAAHVARALRSTDPLERFEDFFKALEYFADKVVGKDLSGGPLADQIRKVVGHVEEKFNDTSFKTYFESHLKLRKRVVHTFTRHGHISPSDIAGIRAVQEVLPELEHLVLALLRNPPTIP